ncbi:MAG: calcium/sodium antiporter [Longimicrobiales bacterium]|nr:calcium/sodium antiporter [Longimicrobiales bacterium]
MTATTILLFVLGGAFLIVGAELLVRGASRLAVAAGISPLVVGLTVVAFGTSSPELAVTVGSAYAGQAELAVGNVVGSNIFNVLFILGLSALVTPLIVAHRLIRLDAPLMVGASLLALVLALDSRVGRLDGVVLFSGIVAYTVFLILQSRKETAKVRGKVGGESVGGMEGASSAAEEAPSSTGDDGPSATGKEAVGGWVLDAGFVIVGLALLVLGSRWFVGAAVDTAMALGVSELVIGLTIVAAGTSLPEVATSVLASVRGERDIAVGNVVGSNIFNLLAVLGLGSLVAPGGIPVSTGALTFDIPVMIAVAIATLPLFFTGHRISRWEGGLFLAYYVAYTVYLALDATDHAALPAFGTAFLWFLLPLTVVTVGVFTVRALREGGEDPDGGR